MIRPVLTGTRRLSASAIIAAILIAAVSLYLILPVLALFFRTTPELFFSSLRDPQVGEALALSLITSTATVLIVLSVGTPAMYFHTRSSYRGKTLVDTVMDLPLVLPPAVAGLALLLLWGRTGLIGNSLNLVGIDIGFTTLAVIMAQVFVASPFYLRQAKSLFEQLDPAYEATARTLGASPLRTFFTITIPLTTAGLVSGAVMTFARALGEFGATIMFAGNLPGVTQTMPLAVYAAMAGDFNAAITISIILVIISFAIMGVTHILAGRRNGRA
jgi:molybdate transport system permease protein